MATLAVAFAACSDSDRNVVAVVTPLNKFTLTSLVADQGVATTIDPNLVNPWGIAFGPTGLLWVANNGTGTSTVYNGNGTKVPTTVTIPGANGLQGVPTGVVLNSTTDFVIVGLGPTTLPQIGPATFIFAGEDGTIAAWAPTAPNNSAVIVADRS
ncbi:MAG TPA: TIGR03118 family protein, partial [Gemmatimonadaceae bacterium]